MTAIDVLMNLGSGKLLSGETVLFDHVTAYMESRDARGQLRGHLEALGPGVALRASDCPYRLELEDNRSVDLYNTEIRSNGLMEPIVLGFRALLRSGPPPVAPDRS